MTISVVANTLDETSHQSQRPRTKQTASTCDPETSKTRYSSAPPPPSSAQPTLSARGPQGVVPPARHSRRPGRRETASRYVAAPPRPAPFRSLVIIVPSPRRAVAAADPTLLTVRNAAGDPLKISPLNFFFCIFFFCQSEGHFPCFCPPACLFLSYGIV